MAQSPQRNLPPEATQWAKWVERQLTNLDATSKNNASKIKVVQSSQQHNLNNVLGIHRDQEAMWDTWELERQAIADNIEEQLNAPQQPLVPTISNVATEAYWDEAGQPRADASVTWLQVNEDTEEGQLLGVTNYEVTLEGLTKYIQGIPIDEEYEVGEEPEIYNSVILDNLPANTQLSVRIRAMGELGGVSEWSEPYTFTTTALPMELLPPSAPTFRTENGAIEVIWDGKLNNGKYPPAYFAYCLVQSRKQGDPIWTNYGQSAGWVLTGLTLGDIYEIRLIAVDTLGRQSEPSETSYVTVKSQAQEAANAAANAEITANGLNARLQHNFGDPLPTVRSNATPLVNGDEVVTWKDGNAVQVQVWNGSSWGKSYLLSGEIFVLSEQGAINLGQGVVDTPQLKAGAIDSFKITSPLIQSLETENRGIKWNGNTLVGYTNTGTEAFRLDGTRATITAGTIQTAASGARVVLDTNGLKAYNASGLETTTITGATGAVSGWSLSGSTITGGLIRTAETGQRIQINSEGLKAYNAAGTVTASILSGVGSLTGAQLDATDITGGTITGALIQTVGTSFRGVKMSSSGLFGYNASNVQTFSIASDTGLVTVTGGTLRSASGTARVELNSTGLKAYNSSGTLTSSIEAASGSFTGATITGGTIQTIATANRGVKITSAGLQGWTNTGVLSAKISADGTDNLLVGKLYTSSPGSPGMILSKTGANLPGIWFSVDGTTDDKNAAIYADDTYSVILRGTTSGLGASEVYAPPVTKGLTVMGPTIGTTGENYPVLHLLQKNGRNTAGYFGWANTAGTLSVLRANDVIAAGRLQDMNAPTTTSAANVYMNPTAGNSNFGRLYRSTSVRAAKVDIQDVGTDPNCILDVAVRDWMDRTQLEDYTNLLEEHALHKAGVRDKLQDPKPKYPRRIPGVVAEELEEVGLGSFCTYDENTGELVGVMYDRLPLLLIPIVREQRDTIARLEQRISALGG